MKAIFLNSLITLFLGVIIGMGICKGLDILNIYLITPIPEFLIGAWSMVGFALVNRIEFSKILE